MQQFVRDREFKLALGVLYTLAMLFFSAFHLGGTSANASEGQFVRGIQFSICFGAGDAGGTSSAGACALCSISDYGFGGDGVDPQVAATDFALVNISGFSGVDWFGYDHAQPPLRGPPVSLS